MRFDPKLIHAEEPPLTEGGDLNLPADLAALSQQLGDDALHLAAQYPAGSVKPEVVSAGRSSSRLTGYVVAGTAVAALLLALLTWYSFPKQPDAKTAAEVADPITALNIAASSTTVPAVAKRRGENVSLVDMSAPELEALFDLLDREPGRAGEVSF